MYKFSRHTDTLGPRPAPPPVHYNVPVYNVPVGAVKGSRDASGERLIDRNRKRRPTGHSVEERNAMKRYEILLSEIEPEEHSIIVEADRINVVRGQNVHLQFMNVTEQGVSTHTEFFGVLGYRTLPPDADTE